MIYIDIEDMTFYDDANVLVKSFYPRTEVAVLRADSVVTEDDMIIKVTVPEKSLSKKEG